MRKKSIMKKCLAGILSFVMTVTLFPANPLGTVEAADGPNPVLHWDMSHADGKLKDISGNNLDGKLVGLDNSDFVTMDDGASQELVFEGEDKNKYVEIPAGALKKAGLETFTLEATYTVTKQSAAWLFTLGTSGPRWVLIQMYIIISLWRPGYQMGITRARCWRQSKMVRQRCAATRIRPWQEIMAAERIL